MNNTVIEEKQEKAMELNGIMRRKEQKQDEKKLEDSQSENSDEDCEEVWRDAKVDMIEKIDEKHISTDNSPGIFDNLALTKIMDDNAGKQKEEFNLGCSLDQEEGEIIGMEGKEKAYDSDGVAISANGNNKNENNTLRKSLKVHTHSQKSNS